MAHKYTVAVSPELSELEMDAISWRAVGRGNVHDDDAILKFALEQEKYLNSEEHRKQLLLARIEEIEAESETEAEKPEPETEPSCAADDEDEIERSRSEELARLREDTRRLSRQSDIKFAVALGIAIAAIVLRIVLTVKQVLH